MSILLRLSLLSLLCSLSLAAVGNSRYHAAKCLALKKSCYAELQRQSGSCRTGLWAYQQSDKCKAQACAWCAVPGKLNIFPCATEVLRSICKLRRRKPGRTKAPEPTKRPAPTRKAAPTKKPSPTKKPMPTGKSAPTGCTWNGGTTVVVDLAKVGGRDGWTRTSRGGMTGLVFEKDKTHGIVSGGSRGKICFNVKSTMSGSFLLTALTAAPHPTDNNDMWVSSSLGFKLLREGKYQSVGRSQWAKAYQNKGGNQIADTISNVDFRPHSFIVPNVKARTVFTICISGRSYKFSVFKLALVKCSGTECSMNRQRSKVSWAASKCY